jgi:short-subunit dehydrogenase
MDYASALIVGAGSGLSASLARAFAKTGMSVALAARSAAKLDEFVQATGAKAFNCDAAKRDEVEKLFADLDAAQMTPDVVVYNASYRTPNLTPSKSPRRSRSRPSAPSWSARRRRAACCLKVTAPSSSPALLPA